MPCKCAVGDLIAGAYLLDIEGRAKAAKHSNLAACLSHVNKACSTLDKPVDLQARSHVQGQRGLAHTGFGHQAHHLAADQALHHLLCNLLPTTVERVWLRQAEEGFAHAGCGSCVGGNMRFEWSKPIEVGSQGDCTVILSLIRRSRSRVFMDMWKENWTMTDAPLMMPCTHVARL